MQNAFAFNLRPAQGQILGFYVQTMLDLCILFVCFVIDNHSYLDHPTYPRNQWKLPAYFRQKSSLEEFGLVPGRLGASREFGKPYMLSEIQFCNLNRYRSEAGTLFAAIVSLQDYDAYYRFSYADSFEISEPRFFAIDNEPVSQLTEKMLHFLFGRGDIAPAIPAVAMTWNDVWLQKQPNLTNEFSSEFYPLVLYGRIGNLREGRVMPGVTALPIGENWETALPSGFAEALKKIRDGGVIKSSTGEVESDPSANRIKIVAPRSEAFSLPKGEMKGRILSVSGVDTFSTISLHSLDGLPLEQSKKMLFFHITNTAATGMKFYDDKCNLLEDWGKLPLLVKNGKVKVRLNLSPAGQFKIETLNWDGSVKKAVDTSVGNGCVEFDADTLGGNMIYYISRQ